MMKVIILLILSLISLPIYAEDIQDSDTAARLVQQSMTTLIQKNAIPGAAVLLYVNGKPIEQYYGHAGQKEPVFRKTIFEIGSISKVMTSILFAQEIDWAKMSLNDPVTKYVKDLPATFNKMTLQDLATHTSGLPFNPPRNITTQDELKQYFSKWSPRDNAYDQWRNSNVGMGLLGYALESSTESDFNDLYRRHILNPLKMVNGVTVPKTLTKYYAEGYDANDNPIPHAHLGLFPAAVGIKASASDMQRFLSAAIGLPGTPPRVFYPMRLTQSMFVRMNDNQYQGLAWQIHSIKDVADISRLLRASDLSDSELINVQEVYQRPVYSGSVLVDKTGATNGFRAYIAVIPNKKSGIVILVNKNVPASAIVKTAREILFKVTNLT